MKPHIFREVSIKQDCARLLKARTSHRHKNAISRHDHRFPISFFKKTPKMDNIFLLKTPWYNNSVHMSTVIGTVTQKGKQTSENLF